MKLPMFTNKDISLMVGLTTISKISYNLYPYVWEYQRKPLVVTKLSSSDNSAVKMGAISLRRVVVVIGIRTQTIISHVFS